LGWGCGEKKRGVARKRVRWAGWFVKSDRGYGKRKSEMG